MDPSVVGIELRSFRFIGKFYFKELFCWKMTNAKVFLLSSLALFGLLTYSPDDDRFLFNCYLFGVYTSLVCIGCELYGIIYRICNLHDFYWTSVIEPEFHDVVMKTK